MNLFQASELELLICGNPVLDMDDLQRGTRYEDGYDETSVGIRYFWEVVQEFDETERKTFLKFVSGR